MGRKGYSEDGQIDEKGKREWSVTQGKCDARLTQKQHNLEERKVKNKSLEYYQHTYYFLF